MSNENKDYLGDGVYVEFSGYDLRLFTPEGHQIFLEQDALKKLVNFAQRQGIEV